MDMNKRYNDYFFKIGSIVSLVSLQVEQHNETLKTIFSALNGIIPSVALTLNQCQKLIKQAMSKTNNQHEKGLFENAAQ